MNPQRLDAMQRTFVQTEDLFCVNTHQILVVGGHLDLFRLRDAIRSTVSEFELCTSGLSADGKQRIAGYWSPEDVPLFQVPYSGEIAFERAPLRLELMRLSQRNPLYWRRSPPLQFFYVTDESGARSALMLNCHHGITDARSDSVLIERLIAHYGTPADTGRAGAGDAPHFPCVSYDEMRVESGPNLTRWQSARFIGGAFARDAFTRRSGFELPRSQAAANELDFHYQEMDVETDLAIRSIARSSKHTINTVITAALHSVVRQSQKPEQALPIKITCPVSLRGLVDARHRHNFQNLMVPCALILQPSYPSTEALFAAISEELGALRREGIWAWADQIGMLAKVAESRLISPFRSQIISPVASDNTAYSNPGVITEKLERFGPGGPPILQYAAFGCLIPSFEFILYTPEFRDRLYLNAIYRRRSFTDVEAELMRPLRAAIARMAHEFESKPAQSGSGDPLHGETQLAAR